MRLRLPILALGVLLLSLPTAAQDNRTAATCCTNCSFNSGLLLLLDF